MKIISKDQYLFYVRCKIPFEGYVRDVGLVTNMKSFRTSPFPENGCTIALTRGTDFYHTVNIQTIIPLASLSNSGRNEELSEMIAEVAEINSTDEITSVNTTMQTWINKLIANINKQQNKNDTKISELRTEIRALTDQVKIAKKNTKIAELESKNAALEQVRTEINALINATNQSYTVIIDNSLKTTDITGSTMTGQSQFNNDTGDFEIRIPSDCSLGLFAHELLHAYQFHIGEFSTGPIIYMHYDLHDELDAYQRGELFGDRSPYRNIDQISKQPNYTGVLDIRKSSPSDPAIIQILNSRQSPVEIDKRLETLAKQRRMTFRVNGKTYRP